MNKQPYNVQCYPIFILDNNVFISCCKLRPYDLEKSMFEFGFYLKPNYWETGLQTKPQK